MVSILIWLQTEASEYFELCDSGKAEIKTTRTPFCWNFFKRGSNRSELGPILTINIIFVTSLRPSSRNRLKALVAAAPAYLFPDWKVTASKEDDDESDSFFAMRVRWLSWWGNEHGEIWTRHRAHLSHFSMPVQPHHWLLTVWIQCAKDKLSDLDLTFEINCTDWPRIIQHNGNVEWGTSKKVELKSTSKILRSNLSHFV